MSSLYFHIPYCRRKCPYCDFYSGGAAIADWERLVTALLNELDSRKDTIQGVFSTLYLGGGTPSLVPAEFLSRLTGGIRDILGERFRPVESTIEVNPEDVSSETVDYWQSAGFNRLSIGLQSLDDAELKAIGRRHSAETALTALDTLLQSGCFVSADLMYGLPGQTQDSWLRSIDTVLSRRPHHISAYALMYEEGTAMTHLANVGKITPASEETYLEMYSALVSRLKDAGYEHYEISNFALPGHRAVHNSAYWQGVPYLGIGPAAHSYDGSRTRVRNLPDLKAYLAANGTGHPAEIEYLDDEMLRDEYLLTRLRTSNGFLLSDFERRFGHASLQALLPHLSLQHEHGTVIIENAAGSDTRVALSPEGVMTSDSVILSLASV